MDKRKNNAQFSQTRGRAKAAVILLFFLVGATPAAFAKWYEASTDHFLVYANQSPKTINKFADRLERYHSAMNWYYGREDIVPSPSNRLTIYVLGSQRKVQKLHGGDEKNIAGFYMPRAGGSVAFVPRISNSKTTTGGPELVLYHEYAHHFQYMVSAGPYPRWITEGLAEFFASARFNSDGDIAIGLPAYHRKGDLVAGERIPIRILLDTNAYEQKRKDMPSWKYDSFYGRSWALFHMLQFSKERGGQFLLLLNGLAEGMSEIESAERAFGDLDTLESDLDNYIQRRELKHLPIPSEKLQVGRIEMRKLGKGEAEIMLYRAEIRRGITEARALELAAEVEVIAKKYPNDILVWETLVQVGVDARLSSNTIRWADQLLELDQTNVAASIYKGMAMAQIAHRQSDLGATWQDVRRQFVLANRMEPDNPLPLIKFYEGYLYAEQRPTANSVNGLIRALQLAPYDQQLRWMVAKQLANDRKYEFAVKALQPLANHPHDPQTSAMAHRMIRQIAHLSEQQDSETK